MIDIVPKRKSGRPTITLPKDHKALANVLWRHTDRVESEYALRRTVWLVAWYYLNGYRRFNQFNPENGKVSAYYLDEDGNAEFQSQALLYKLNQVCGRLLAMDVGPKVMRRGGSLASIRGRAVAQIFADSVADPVQLRQVHEEFVWTFASLGFAGVCGHLVDHPTVGLVSDIEMVHPRELYPFPASSTDYTKSQSIMRVRYVSLDFLRERYGARRMNALEDKLEIWDADPGDDWQERHSDDAYPSLWEARGNSGGGSSNPGDKGEWIRVVKFRELWLRDEVGLVGRYVASSGEAIIEDRDFQGGEVYCPVGYARFFNTGGFYGAGMFDSLFSIHRVMEKMMKQLFNNIEELDRYGVLVLPQGELPEKTILRDVGKGLKVATWAPDPFSEGFNPFVIQPHNAGDVPGRVAQFAREAMDDVDPIRNLIEEKGRVDSASGLQYLDEEITRALSTPTWGIQQAFGTMYRSLTHRAVMMAMESDRAVPVVNLTLDLAGAIIDPDHDTVSFDENPVPDIKRLEFSIREVAPRSEASRKEEAVQLWRDGIETDPVAFRLFGLREGLDFALWQEDDKGALEASTRIILQLYGNGEEPGQITVTARTVKPDLLVRLVQSFMVGPHMQKASPTVVDEFQKLHDTCVEWMGLALPAAVPNPDDAAMLGQPGMPMMGMGGMAGALPGGTDGGEGTGGPGGQGGFEGGPGGDEQPMPLAAAGSLGRAAMGPG